MASIIHQELPLSTADDEIRLLKILPGGWSDHVRIQLFIANLNHRPEYKALSYVWGEDKPSDEYRVFGNDHSISVTKNLFQALRRIRAHQKLAEEALWIDAICIDQSFTEERNHQVRIMGKIYTDCTGGLVWLGDLESSLNKSRYVEAHRECWSFAGDFSDYERLWARLVNTFDMTRRESANVKKCIRNGAIKAEERILDVEWANYANHLSLGESAFHAAWFLRQLPERYPSQRTIDPYMNLPHPLFGSCHVMGNWSRYWESVLGVLAIVVKDPWWRRLWVVQELALPPDIQFLFGPVSIAFNIFTDALYFMQNCNVFSHHSGREGHEILDLASRHWKEIVNLRSRQQPFSQGKPAFTTSSTLFLRQQTLHRDATCDHDQIYSILGLSASPLHPDYSCDPAIIYTQVSKEAVEKDKKLAILSYASTKHKFKHVPSWVVDWTMLQETPERRAWYEIWTSCISNISDQHYPALPKESFQQKSPVFNGQVLEVDGAKMDRVLMVLPHRWESPKEKALHRQSEDFLSCFGDPKEVYAEKWLFGEVWLRTLCLDMKWGQKGLTRSTDALQKKEFEDLIRLSGWKDVELCSDGFVDGLCRSELTALRKGQTLRHPPEPHRGFSSLGHPGYPVVKMRSQAANCEEEVRREEGQRRHVHRRPKAWSGRSTSEHERESSRLSTQWIMLKRSIEARMFERTLFVTETGYLGSANQAVAVGDEIYLLPGAVVPIILRPCSEGNDPDQVSLVGDSFILGLMNHGNWQKALQQLRRIYIV